MQEVLEDILATIELKACVYFERRFHAPWAMQVPANGTAQFHLILEGTAVIERDGRVVELSPGDMVLFPRGAAHALADRPERTPRPGREVVEEIAAGRPVFSCGGRATRLVCGHYEYARPCVHPLFEELPDEIVLSLGARSDQMGEQRLVDLLIEECEGQEPGGSATVRRLSEVLLIRFLRRFHDVHPAEAGFLAGVMDLRLARAITRIHRDYARPLTVAALAEGAGMSRSAFAESFRDKTGLAPIEYLTRWRMSVACQALGRPGVAIAEVAAGCGYESEVAFMRAFRRLVGMTPAKYRRMRLRRDAA